MQLSPDDATAIAVTLLAGSELLSLMPKVKANGWIQLFLAALRGIAATKKR
jgi:hypothetical protein